MNKENRLNCFQSDEENVMDQQNNETDTHREGTKEESKDFEMESGLMKMSIDADQLSSASDGDSQDIQPIPEKCSITVHPSEAAVKEQGQLPAKKSRILKKMILGKNAEPGVKYQVKYVKTTQESEERTAACCSDEVPKSQSNPVDYVDSNSGAYKKKASITTASDNIKQHFKNLWEKDSNYYRKQLREQNPGINFDVESTTTLQDDLSLVHKHQKERKKMENTTENKGSEVSELDKASMSVSAKCVDSIDKQSQIGNEKGAESNEQSTKNPQVESDGRTNIEDVKVKEKSEESKKETLIKNSVENPSGLNLSPEESFVNDSQSLKKTTRTAEETDKNDDVNNTCELDKAIHCRSEKGFGCNVSDPKKSANNSTTNIDISSESSSSKPSFYDLERNTDYGKEQTVYIEDCGADWKEDYKLSYKTFSSKKIPNPDHGLGKRDVPESRKTEILTGASVTSIHESEGNGISAIRPNPTIPATPSTNHSLIEDPMSLWDMSNVSDGSHSTLSLNGAVENRKGASFQGTVKGSDSIPKQSEGSRAGSSSQVSLDIVNDPDSAFVWDLYQYINARKMGNLIDFKKLPLSPFSPSLQRNVLMMLECKEKEMHFIAVLYTVVPEEVASEAVQHFVERPFCPQTFLWLFVYLCNHFALGKKDPVSLTTSLGILVGGIRTLRENGEFTDKTWRHVQAAGNSIRLSLHRSYGKGNSR